MSCSINLFNHEKKYGESSKVHRQMWSSLRFDAQLICFGSAIASSDQVALQEQYFSISAKILTLSHLLYHPCLMLCHKAVNKLVFSPQYNSTTNTFISLLLRQQWVEVPNLQSYKTWRVGKAMSLPNPKRSMDHNFSSLGFCKWLKLSFIFCFNIVLWLCSSHTLVGILQLSPLPLARISDFCLFYFYPEHHNKRGRRRNMGWSANILEKDIWGPTQTWKMIALITLL